MFRLRKEIERLDVAKCVAGIEERAEVAHLGGRIATDIDHGARGEGDELAEEVFIRASPGRVDDDRGLGAGGGDVLKDVPGGAGGKSAVGDLIPGGIAAGALHGADGDFDPGD